MAQLIDDLVVVQIVGQAVGGNDVAVHEDRQAAIGSQLAALDRHALFDQFRRCVGQGAIDQPDGLAAIGGDAGLAGFELVEFLEDGHRNDDVVFFEVEEGVGIVNQDVGIEDVEGVSGGSARFHKLSPRKGRKYVTVSGDRSGVWQSAGPARLALRYQGITCWNRSVRKFIAYLR